MHPCVPRFDLSVAVNHLPACLHPLCASSLSLLTCLDSPPAPTPHPPTCLQYCYLGFCILVLLPLSLPINGTDWSRQFGGWGASDWAVLALTSSVVCVGANYAIQVPAAPPWEQSSQAAAGCAAMLALPSAPGG